MPYYYCLDTLTLKTWQGILRLWIVILCDGLDNPRRCYTTGVVCQSPMGHPLSLSLCAHTKNLENHSYPLDGTIECILKVHTVALPRLRTEIR